MTDRYVLCASTKVLTCVLVAFAARLDAATMAYASCDRICRDHEDHQKGFLWFLAHDPRLPKIVRHDANIWGLARDEYTDTGHWPNAAIHPRIPVTARGARIDGTRHPAH